MKLRLNHPQWRRWAPVLARLLAQGYLRTCTAEMVSNPETRDLIFSGRPMIFAIWHCHLLFPLFFLRHYRAQMAPLAVMASPSRDGEFIAAIARGLGCVVCSGSRGKGGVQALQEMAAYFRRGYSCGLVADGSRGPARIAQKGPLYLARETQAPILPVAVASRRKLTFNTWDRFELPLPASRLALLMGAPLWVRSGDRGPALEQVRRQLESRLNHLFHQAQTYFSP